MALTTTQLLSVFMNALFIVPDSSQDDMGVFFGHVSILEPVGLNAVLTVYTQRVDMLLERLPLTPSQYLSIITSRAFTYEEYKELWHIKPTRLSRSKAAHVLLITSEEQRQLFISVAVDDSHESFVLFLERYTKRNNSFLHNFLYEIYT